jgi:hypothetical protein
MRIQWIVGQKYTLSDIMDTFEAELVGFIVNQIPVSWKDQSSYSNRSDDTTYLVFKYSGRFMQDPTQVRYVCSSGPKIRSSFPSWGGEEINIGYSDIYLYGDEYADSIEGLIKKLKQNWVFTSKLSYEAKYQEGYKDENLL